MNRAYLNKKLSYVAKIAHASKIQRMLKNPVKYIFSILYSKIIYKIIKKGILLTTDTFFNTKMTIILPSGLDIYLTGGKSHDSEIRLARYLINNLNEGDHFIDIGAHFGYFTLLGSKLVGEKGKVFSYEASKETFRILEKNVCKSVNIYYYNNAITEKNESIEFYEFPVLYSEYNSIDMSQFKNENWFSRFSPKKILVEGTRLDDIIEKNNIQPNIIKIDVEGAEYKVISGVVNTLKKADLKIVMEFLCKERHNESHNKAVNFLKSLGYNTHVITEDGSTLPCDDIEGYLNKNHLESDNILISK